MEKEVFEDFLRKLEIASISPKLIDKLKKLWEENKLESKEEILNAVREVVKDGQS